MATESLRKLPKRGASPHLPFHISIAMTVNNSPHYQFVLTLDPEFRMPNQEFYVELTSASDRVFHDAHKHEEVWGEVREMGPDRETFGHKVLTRDVGRLYTYDHFEIFLKLGHQYSSYPDPIEQGVFEKTTFVVVNTKGLGWEELQSYLRPLQNAWSELGYSWPSSPVSVIPWIEEAELHESQDVVDALVREMEKLTLAYVARPSYLLRLDGLARLDIPAILRTVPKPAKVKQVYLSSAGLAELPTELRHFPNLQRLWIGQNKIDTLPSWITEFESLIEVRLHDNPISEEQVNALRTRLPKVKIAS